MKERRFQEWPLRNKLENNKLEYSKQEYSKLEHSELEHSDLNTTINLKNQIYKIKEFANNLYITQYKKLI